jgi:glycosyltransferase involved in cell wall biosynthesis
MTGHLAVLVHDGFYGAGTGAGYANHAVLDVLARHLAPDVHLHVLPVHLTTDSPEHDLSWHHDTLDLLAQHPRHHVHPLDNGTDGLVRFSGLPAFKTLATSAASALHRGLPPAGEEVLIIAFDVPFLGLPPLLAPRLARSLLLVPRSTALLHAPADRDRIAFEAGGLRAAVALGARIGTISAHMRSHLHAHLAVPHASLIDLPDGLTTLDRQFGTPRDDLLPPGGRSGFVLALGRAEPYKGWDDLLDAVHLLTAEGVALPPVLIAAVTQDHGPGDYQHHLAHRIEELSLPVTLRTRFDHRLRDLLTHSQLQALVVPSRREPFGRLPLEAFAAGAGPVVATTAGGLAEQVIDDVTGYTAAPHDPPALAHAIRRALERAPADRARLTAAGRQLLDTHHDHERAVLDTLRHLAPWALNGSIEGAMTGPAPDRSRQGRSASGSDG